MTSPVLCIEPTIRVRRTPFWDGVIREGATSASVYNHMILPMGYGNPEKTYRHLKTRVQLWDVACQRQVEVRGPDATELIAMMVPRDISRLKSGRCYYFPAVDHMGGMLNDPVLIRLSDNRYWVSLADSDLLMWALGLAAGLKMDVEIFEPDVSPLAVQGPMASDLMVRVFGSSVNQLKFFGFDHFDFAGREFVISRTGFSKQGGFEIYVDGSENGMPVWNALMEAGRDLQVGPGCPNHAERIESGLLSYGSDMTRMNNPFECGLTRYCDPEFATPCLGSPALKRMAETGVQRQIRSLAISGDPVSVCHVPWKITVDGQFAGHVTSAAWSWDFSTNAAIGMIEAPYWTAGTELKVHAPDGIHNAVVRSNFFN